MIEFSMTNHSADPNQRYLARIRKLIHFYGTDPEKRSKQMQKPKEIMFSVGGGFLRGDPHGLVRGAGGGG